MASIGFDKKTTFSVGQISSIISEVIKSELFMGISVKGEIKSVAYKGGHCYITLIDSKETSLAKQASLRVNIFSWYLKDIKDNFKEGDEIIAYGDLSYYAGNSSISLNAKNAYLAGEGLELIRLKKLEEKLEKEGLFAPEKKRALPKNIKKIGIVTSQSGAAYHDIKETLKKKIPVSTVLFDAVVQGGNAPASLIRALDRAYKSDVDIIIFGRGGGSKTDLACFNDEQVVRKLAQSPKVVISGIGHEIDRSLCDLAADIYAITPTDAANKALPDLDVVLGELMAYKDELDASIDHILANYALSLSSYRHELEKNSPKEKINNLKSKFSLINNKLDSSYLTYLNDKQRKLKDKEYKLSEINRFVDKISNYLNLSNTKLLNLYASSIESRSNRLKDKSYKLELLNPLNNLREGTVLIKKNNKLVRSIKELSNNDKVELGFKDGVAISTIEEIKED